MRSFVKVVRAVIGLMDSGNKHGYEEDSIPVNEYTTTTTALQPIMCACVRACLAIAEIRKETFRDE
jgi:hypothetical protein